MTNHLSTHKPTFRSFLYLIDNMRQADRDELAARGKTPKEALVKAVRLKNEQTMRVIQDSSGTPLAIFGVNYEGGVWMLGTDGLLDHKREFLRRSRPYVKALKKRYGTLWNSVYIHNTVHVRWLKWLGATLWTEDYFEKDFVDFVI